MKVKLTDWYGPDQKPVRAGSYETRFKCENKWYRGYSLWTGEFWACQFETPERAIYDSLRSRQTKEWRGLAKEPKK